jgi:hypothetical protein
MKAAHILTRTVLSVRPETTILQARRGISMADRLPPAKTRDHEESHHDPSKSCSCHDCTIALLLGSASAQAQIRFTEYSAKFLCGEAKEGVSVRPGNYETSINIHNPQFQPVSFAKKAVRSLREGETPIAPSDWKTGLSLAPNFAEQVDCKVVRGLLGPVGNDPFIEGFVVLFLLPFQWRTTNEFDVVGVYTVDTPPQSISLEIVPVAYRFITFSSTEGRRLHDQMLQRSKP